MARKTHRKPRLKGGAFHQLPRRDVRNPNPPVCVLDEGQVEQIHDASLTLLETMGMDFLDDDARETLRRAGAQVEAGGNRVRMDRGMVLEAVARAPSQFTLTPRNPANRITIGGDHVVFCSVASAPNCSDLDGGRRVGNYKDFNNFLKLTQTINIVHALGGYPVEPVDLPAETRHLDCCYSALTLTDKVWHPYALGAQRCADAVNMLSIASGRTPDQLRREPGLFTVVNTSSPMRIDAAMLQGLKELALAGQAITVTPFTLSGAMSPVTLAGALAQQNAEALATIAYTQILAPGVPCIYGGFTSNVDMKSGSPAFGTPEYARAAIAGGQLARRYGLPYRSSNVNTANALGIQAGYESMMSLWAAVMSGANLIMHGAGWMESGLVASFEKMIIDTELLQMMAEFLAPIRVDDSTLALDAIREAGPGGHFFGTAHTLERYETAFYQPLISDWRNFESWRETGAGTAAEKANTVYKEILGAYQPPALDPAIDEELKAFMERRRGEIRRVA
jgi:trimethylamine--corrinoid protein Co-methyltransferase